MNTKAISFTVALFSIEVFIAVFVRDTFVRPFLGDTLSIIFLYSFFRIWLKHSLKLVAFVFAIGCLLEYLQWIQILKTLGLEHLKWLKIVLGSSFDWGDMLAYTVGALIISLNSFDFKKEIKKYKQL